LLIFGNISHGKGDFMKIRKSWVTSTQYPVILALLSPMAFVSAHAAGKKPTDPGNGGGGPIYKTPNPSRAAVIQEVGTRAFQMPNGGLTNFGADLQPMLITSVTNSSNFAAADPYQADPCDSHLEVRAAVTTFQLDLFELGLSVGYNPNGQLGPITGISGSVNTRVGLISMDFSAWQCSRGRCTSVAAASSTSADAGVGLSMKIDFTVVKTGPDLIFNTPLGSIIRGMMNKGMNRLAASAALSKLPWQANVMEYMPSTGTLFFDAGVTSRINPNETFTIYARTDDTSTGVCNVYRPVAYAHTSRVDTVSSEAIVDQVLDSRGIRAGDVVMIRQTSQ
jgi:hypothetical protein